jgi:hypothetical protein
VLVVVTTTEVAVGVLEVVVEVPPTAAQPAADIATISAPATPRVVRARAGTRGREGSVGVTTQRLSTS